jgi:drug/metabolite transporter (DMT)-like permease
MPRAPVDSLPTRLESRALSRWGPTRLALALMAAAMLVWPVIEGLGGLVLPSMHPLQLIWARYAVHLTLLLGIARFNAAVPLMRTQYPAVQIGRSLLMLGMPAFWLMAAARMPMPTVMAVFWTTPIMAIVGAALFLREYPTRRDVVLVLVGYAGILLVLRPSMPGGLGGPVFALAMAGCYAIYLVATRWLRREPTSVNLFQSALSVFVVLTLVMPAVWRAAPVSAWIVSAVIGALGLLLLFLIDRALHHATVGRTAALGFLQPTAESLVFGAALGVVDSTRMRVGLVVCAAVMVLCVVRSRHDVTELPKRLE